MNRVAIMVLTGLALALSATQPANARIKLDPQHGLTQLPPAPVRVALHFEPGTTEISSDLSSTIDFLRQEISARPGAVVRVTGYGETMAMNDEDRLSQRRAQQVLVVLAQQGIDARMINMAAHDGQIGANRPVLVVLR